MNRDRMRLAVDNQDTGLSAKPETLNTTHVPALGPARACRWLAPASGTRRPRIDKVSAASNAGALFHAIFHLKAAFVWSMCTFTAERTAFTCMEERQHMQRVLEKMAKQLNAYDEASLMQLWQNYAIQVNEFEPTKRWEEAAIALCLIQAIRWKNQLFNYHLAESASPMPLDEAGPMPDFLAHKRGKQGEEDSGDEDENPKATVLRFPPKETAKDPE